MSGEATLGLYLHIPFCRHRCAYCDFNTYSTLSELVDAYVDALRSELCEVAGVSRRPAATVFFGGGTPSLLKAESIRLLIDDIKDTFVLKNGAEITIEANPETLSWDYLSAVRQAGVNRLSLGVQSADAGELALLEREHDFATVVQAVDNGRAAGFENISLDLIYGLPGQSLASWERSLSAVMALNPDHLSLYCLTIEAGTPMNRWLTNGQIEAPDPDLAAEQYELAAKTLERAGFQHYEISNWSRLGLACQHNLIYWRNGAYLGLGAGAHGHAAGYRYSVVRQPRVYIRRMRSGEPGRFPWSAALAEKRLLSRKDMMADTVITQLRLLNEGINLDDFEEQFGVHLFSAFPGVNEQMIEWGMLQQSDSRLLLTEKGQFLSNQVFYRFM
jgi:oxygen-independent coproporphyrinogen-3 oxidase